MDSQAAIIAFMGVTGSGKTTLIRALTGDESIHPENGLESAVQGVTAHSATINSVDYILVDTPGFDDTYRSEPEILNELATWLSDTFRDGQKLTALVYMHGIHIARSEGSRKLNIATFQELCGSKSYKNIILCSTFWDCVDENVGAEREQQLLKSADLWGKMSKGGAQVIRMKTYAKTQHLVDCFAALRPITLKIQTELVTRGLDINDTAAGRTVNTELRHVMEEAEKQVRKEREASAKRQKELEARQKRQDEQANQQAGEIKKLQARIEQQERELKEQLEQTEKEREKVKKQNEEDKKRAEAERAEKLLQVREEGQRMATSLQLRRTWHDHTKILYQAQVKRTACATIWKTKEQPAAYLKWCDHCFEAIGLNTHFHCKVCCFDICATCWRQDRSCYKSSHSPAFESRCNPDISCTRLLQNWTNLKCDHCRDPIYGLCFHCCDCFGDDYDLCLSCVVKGRTCLNRQHILHPTVSWPTWSSMRKQNLPKT